MKNWLANSIMKKLIFLSQKKDYCKIEKQNNICIIVFYYDNKLTYPVYLSDQKFESCMELLLISDECKSHYVYIKDLVKLKIKVRNIFVSIVYSVLVVKKF